MFLRETKVIKCAKLIDSLVEKGAGRMKERDRILTI